SGTRLAASLLVGPQAGILRGALAMSSSSDSGDATIPDPEPVRERLQKELALIDEQWQVEQKSHEGGYSGEGGGAKPELPNHFRTIWSVGAGFSFVGFGIWHMSMGGWGPVSLGAFFILVGIWIPVVIAWRHRRYVRAREEYLHRRGDVLSK